MKCKVTALLVVLAALAVEVSAFADLVTASRATVRITHQDGVSNGIGSGVIVGSDTAAYYALTNAHVAPAPAVIVEFFRDGKVAAVTKGKTIARDTAADVAVVQITKEQLGNYVPSIIPIDPAYTLTAGDTLGTIGHPHGEGPTAYICHYIKRDELGLHFQPPPKQGRSGSALFDRDFTRVIGLVYAVTADGSQVGLAVPAASFGRAIGRMLSAYTPREPFRVQRNRAIQTIQLYDQSDKDTDATPPAPAIQKTSAIVNVLETSNDGAAARAVEAAQGIEETQCPGGRCPNRPTLPQLPKIELPRSGSSDGETILPSAPLPIQQTPQEQPQTQQTPQVQEQPDQTSIRQQMSELGERLRQLEIATGRKPEAPKPEAPQQTEQQAGSSWYPGQRIVEGVAGDVQKKTEETASDLLDKVFQMIVWIALIFLACCVGIALIISALSERVKGKLRKPRTETKEETKKRNEG